MKIAYLVHDLLDAAVAKRVGHFRAGGAAVRVGGFVRGSVTAPGMIGGVPAMPLGTTQDARLAQRAGAVLDHVLRPGRVRAITADADVIVARNLEMLAIAARVRRKGQRLVYECLDIHRLLLGHGAAARGVQALEARLLRATDLVIVSSPSYRDAYFRERRGYAGPILLFENKALGDRPALSAPPAGPPWRIGWFGMLRCARSLAQLSEIVRRGEGRIEVIVAGRPAYTEFDDFDAQVAAVPGLSFVGAYTAADLPRLYGEIHYAWAIDYFEEGMNSAWLLPNRLYESLAHGAVPIALTHVATGAWLAAHDVGVLVDDPVAEVPALLAEGDARHAPARAKVADVADAAVRITDADIAALMAALCGRGA